MILVLFFVFFLSVHREANPKRDPIHQSGRMVKTKVATGNLPFTFDGQLTGNYIKIKADTVPSAYD